MMEMELIQVTCVCTSGDGSSWNQLGNDIDGGATTFLAGSSVSISADGSVVAIGAPALDTYGIDGRVSIYKWDGVSESTGK